MISCLLIQISRTQQGLPVRRESVITGESIQIGRGAGCKIHLLDHRVHLFHATVRRSEDGLIFIDGEKDVAININGFIGQHAELSPGTRVEIGPYLLVVEPVVAGHDITLSVEMAQYLSVKDAVPARPTAPTTLAALGLSKRKMGFTLAAFICFVFLVFPLLPSVSSAVDKWQSTLPVTLTDSWTPGALSGGHRVFGFKCSTCHQRPFQAVADETCVGCHKQVTRHIAKDDLHSGVFKNTRCTQCHVDHRGKMGMIMHDSEKCVSCHGDIKRKKADTKIGDVRDFDKNHPSFHLMLLDGKDKIRVKQDEVGKWLEKPGLKFSHQIHLDKNGISSPLGDILLTCPDCHKIEDSGIHFAPLNMQKSCQQSRCHALDFTEPVEGEAPHGSERAALNRLREFYSKWLTESPANLATCDLGDVKVKAENRVLACVNHLALKNAGATLFRQDKECGECHEVKPTDDLEVPWKITPITINRDWQPGATFDHAKHGTMNCTECHDKINSKSSTEISMPNIVKCRECHVGEHDVAGKIKNTCDSCHRFHKFAK
jgi:hypothetical protein